MREYPPLTEQQAIFARVADKNGVTLRIYHRLVEAAEQRKIIQNATRKNKMKSTANDMTDSVEAEGNLQDVIDLLAGLRKSRECLLHCTVFIELKAKSLESLRELQNETLMELARAKITVDRLTLGERNKWLAENCDMMIVYIKRDYGGAYKCYKYAQELGVPIMNVADNIKNQEW